MSTIFITGTSRGIGNQLANHYLELGNEVIGCSRGDSNISHSNYTHHTLNIANHHWVSDVFRAIERVDILINNAGISSMNHFLTTPLETAIRILDTNLLGTISVSKEAAKIMSRHEFGRIINFSSIAEQLNIPGESIYSASKASIVSLTRTLAYELAPFGITVNAIGPNPIKTDLIKGVPEEKLQALISRQAIKRYGTVEDVANIIDFLVKPESNFITGQTIYLGGIS